MLPKALPLLATAVIGVLLPVLPGPASGDAPAAAPAAAAAVTSPQLLVNPGFEAGLAGWRASWGNPTVATYGATDSVATTAPGPPSRGAKYLTGGTSEDSALVQTIDVSGYADEFQLGTAQLEVSGYLGGWGRQADDATVTVFAEDSEFRNLCAGDCPELKGPTILQRTDTGLLRMAGRFEIPRHTSFFTVRIDLARTAGIANDGYADGLSVRIVNLDGVSPPPPPPAGSSAELVRNGRFDAASGGTGNPVRAPGWTTGIAVRYDAGGGYPTVADPVPSDHGPNFWAGDPVALTASKQLISVAGWSTILDRGRTIARLSAHLGGYLADDDAGGVTVGFLDAGMNQPGSSFVHSPEAAERYGRTGLWYVSSDAMVPPGTRWLEVTLLCHRSTGTACDTYADDVSVRLLNVPPAPVVRSVTPSFVARGTTRSITIAGTGFVSGATVAVSGAGVTVSNVAFVSSTQLTATVSVTGAASTGKRTVTVTNPSTVKGSCSCLNIT